MAVYYVYSGAAGSNNGSSWANAFTTLTTAFATEAAGDTLYVAHDHAESTASAVTLTSSGVPGNPTKIVCVNRAGSVPPVSVDRRATAQVTTTGANGINLAGSAHYDGVIFNCGTGATIANLVVGSSSGANLRLDNCSLRSNTTGNTTNSIQLGTSNQPHIFIALNNTTVSFGHVGQNITCYATVKWRDTPSALLGTVPTTLLAAGALRGTLVECVGVDLSGAGSGKTIADTSALSQGASFTFIDCKLDASVTKAASPASWGSAAVDFVRSSSSGNYAVCSIRAGGSLTEETTIVRTGGATDGTTAISWKIVTNTLCTYSLPFECPPIAVWNDTTGSSVTAAVEGIWGGGAVPNDDDIWLDVEYLGDASSPQGSFVNDGKANLLATAAGQTSSSETWGGSTTKFKLSVSFTPQMRGWVYGRIKCAKASSTFYVDPKLTLS